MYLVPFLVDLFCLKKLFKTFILFLPAAQLIFKWFYTFI